MRYAADGVIRSEEICAYTGTRLGALEDSKDLDRTSWIVSRLGSRSYADNSQYELYGLSQ